MKKLVICLLVLMLGAPAFAQSTQSDRDYSNGRLKFITGIGAMVLGGAMAATSRTTVEIPMMNVPNVKLSDTSVGRLTVGLAMAGGGAYLMFNGRRQMKS